MANFGDQIEVARTTHIAVRALEAAVRLQVADAFNSWERGEYDETSVRYRLEAIVRSAYRASSAVGLAHISAAAGVPRWRPHWAPRRGPVRSPYLDDLLADVRRNLRDYKASPRAEVDRIRAISRISHSAGVAVSRGKTEAMLRSARELSQDHGFILRKIWLANFVNHTPCDLCAHLHMTEADLDAEFPIDPRLQVYGDLKGPPLHPRCMCTLVVLFVGLENHQEADTPVTGDTPEPQTMTTEGVKALPQTFFQQVVKWLRGLVRFLTPGSGGFHE